MGDGRPAGAAGTGGLFVPRLSPQSPQSPSPRAGPLGSACPPGRRGCRPVPARGTRAPPLEKLTFQALPRPHTQALAASLKRGQRRSRDSERLRHWPEDTQRALAEQMRVALQEGWPGCGRAGGGWTRLRWTVPSQAVGLSVAPTLIPRASDIGDPAQLKFKPLPSWPPESHPPAVGTPDSGTGVAERARRETSLPAHLSCGGSSVSPRLPGHLGAHSPPAALSGPLPWEPCPGVQDAAAGSHAWCRQLCSVFAASH